MAKQSSSLRQRGSSAAAAPQQQQQQQQANHQQQEEQLTTLDRLNWYIAQHIGLVFCGTGVGLLGLGYDKGWMHNTHLCMLCLALCLVGLFCHEFRPFNAQQAMEEQQKAASAAAS